MAAVWEFDLPLTDKLILLAFADHADDFGHCFPRYELIAWKCGVSRDTVKRAVARFRASGLLIVLRPGAGRGHAPRYRIQLERGGKLPPLCGGGESFPQDIRGCGKLIKGGKLPLKGGTAMPPEPSLEPSQDLNPAANPAAAPQTPRRVPLPPSAKPAAATHTPTPSEQTEIVRKRNAKAKRLVKEINMLQSVCDGAAANDPETLRTRQRIEARVTEFERVGGRVLTETTAAAAPLNLAQQIRHLVATKTLR